MRYRWHVRKLREGCEIYNVKFRSPLTPHDLKNLTDCVLQRLDSLACFSSFIFRFIWIIQIQIPFPFQTL